MRRRVDDPLTYALVWVALGIILPLTPIFVGVIIHLMQRTTLELPRLVNGIELFLITLWLSSATAWDMSKSRLAWSRPLRVLLIGLAALSLVFLVAIYIDNRVRSLDFDSVFVVQLAFGHFLVTSVMTVALQLYMSIIESRGAVPEDSRDS